MGGNLGGELGDKHPIFCSRLTGHIPRAILALPSLGTPFLTVDPVGVRVARELRCCPYLPLAPPVGGNRGETPA